MTVLEVERRVTTRGGEAREASDKALGLTSCTPGMADHLGRAGNASHAPPQPHPLPQHINNNVALHNNHGQGAHGHHTQHHAVTPLKMPGQGQGVPVAP